MLQPPHPVEILPATDATAESDHLSEVIPLYGPESGLESRCAVNFVQGEVVVDNARKPVPYTVAVPAELQADTLAVGVNGFGAVKRTSREFRNALAGQHGVATLSYDPVRAHESSSPGDWSEQFFRAQHMHEKTIEAIADHVPNNPNFKNVPYGTDVQKALLSLILNSMGGLAGSEFAVNHRDELACVVYLGSIGLDGPLGIKLIPRTGKVLAMDALPGLLRGELGPVPTMIAREARYFVSNPLRTAGEIKSCFDADIRPQFFELGRKGVPRGVVCFERDDYFHPHDSLVGLGSGFEYRIVRGARHTAMQKRHEATRVAGYVGPLIKSLLAPAA